MQSAVEPHLSCLDSHVQCFPIGSTSLWWEPNSAHTIFTSPNTTRMAMPLFGHLPDDTWDPIMFLQLAVQIVLLVVQFVDATIAPEGERKQHQVSPYIYNILCNGVNLGGRTECEIYTAWSKFLFVQTKEKWFRIYLLENPAWVELDLVTNINTVLPTSSHTPKLYLSTARPGVQSTLNSQQLCTYPKASAGPYKTHCWLLLQDLNLHRPLLTGCSPVNST